MDHDQCSPMSTLPCELLENIFQYMTHSDMKYMGLVCKRWLKISDGRIKYLNNFLRINGNNEREILEPFTMNHLIEREFFHNVRIFSIQMEEELFKLCGKYMKTLELIWIDPYRFLKLACQYSINLEILTVYGIYEGGKGIIETNNLEKLRKLIVSGYNYNVLQYFWNFHFPLEVVHIETESQDTIPFLNKHLSSLKSIKVSWDDYDHNNICNDFDDDNGGEWIETFSRMQCLEELSLAIHDKRGFPDYHLKIFKNGSLRNLKFLEITVSNSDVSKLIKILPDACPFLINLIINAKKLNDDWFPAISRLSQLKVLDLRRSGAVSNEGISKLAVIRNLRELHLGDVTLTEECVRTLAENLRDLRALDLSQCIDGINDRALQAIYCHLIHLRTLKLSCCEEITDMGLTGSSSKYSIQRLKGLRTLIFAEKSSKKGKKFSNAIFELRFLELTVLHLNHFHITESSIKSLIENCGAIETLILISCEIEKDFESRNMIRDGFKRLRYFSTGFLEIHEKVLGNWSVKDYKT